MRPLLHPPSIKSESLNAIRKKLELTSEPVLLPIRPIEGALPQDCFDNVRRLCDEIGGKVVFGWSIWEWPHVFIEAEHHAVYRDETDGSLRDITTSSDNGDQYRVFLEDQDADYNFANTRTRRDNVRLAIAEDSRVYEFFSIAEKLHQILEEVPGFGLIEFEGEEAAEIRALQKRQLELQFELAMTYTPRGAPCFCGSGLKFKRCHGEATQGVVA